jgi:hypothetical protein
MNLDKLPTIDWIAVRKTLLSIQPITVGKWLCAVFGLGVLACLIQQCLTPQPIVLPPAPITQAPGITHIPTRTLTATWTITPSRTATARPATATHTFTATVTERAATSTATYTPSSTPSATRIPAGRDTLPKTGLSEQEIAELTPTITATSEAPAIPHCNYKWKVVSYHWESGEWVMTLRCPKEGGTPAAESVAD